MLTSRGIVWYNTPACLRYGGIAQLARACGSYPQCPRFKSRCRYQLFAGCQTASGEFFSPFGKQDGNAWSGSKRSAAEVSLPTFFSKKVWPGGQVAKTPPFHGGNTSSSLVRVTKKGRFRRESSLSLMAKWCSTSQSNGD